MEGSKPQKNRVIVTYAHPRTQGSDRPAAGAARGVSVLQRGGRHDLRRQGARPARPRPQLSGRLRERCEDRRAARRGRPPRGDRHRLSGRGARAREQPDQAAVAQVQHPAARRQELSLPAAHGDRGLSAGAGRAPLRARRQLLCRTVHAGAVRAQDDGAHAPAVRDPVVQRGDHRQTRPALPRIRHQALHRAVRRHASVPRRNTAARWGSPSSFSRDATTSC